MNDKYILYALAFSFIFVSAFVLLSFSEVKITEDKFTKLYFNSTIIENEGNSSYLDGAEIRIENGAIVIDNLVTILPGDTFFVNGKGYTLNMVTKDAILLYNYTKKTDDAIYFNFTIENQEGIDKDYHYDIYIGKDKVLEGNEFLKSNEKKIIEKVIQYRSLGDHRLTIKLNTGAEIYFNFSSVEK